MTTSILSSPLVIKQSNDGYRHSIEPFLLAYFANLLPDYRILDIGTGCGIIPLLTSIKIKLGEIVAIEIQKSLYDLAVINMSINGILEKVNLCHADFTGPALNPKDGLFDTIISNPPYIPSNDINNLQIEVKKFEPRLALDGGKDGMDSYKSILPNIIDIIKPEGKIFLEIGHNQQNLINKIANKCELIFKDSNKDLSGIIRVLVYGLK